jgi:hypothetical protein
MKNLPEIKKGSTWSFSIRSWIDKERTQPIDLTQFSFLLIATNAAGATVITLDNNDFVEVSDEERRVTLSKTETQALPAGELAYQLDVTNSDSTSDEWFRGFVNVVA